MTSSITRDFTVATFVVQDDKVLLLFHRKLQMWLPPGGHIEPNELPDEAAVREVLEETGIAVELVGRTGLNVPYPRQLIRPEGIQVEDIAPGHQHIDLVYFARPLDSGKAPVSSQECEQAGWYGLDDLEAMNVSDEIRQWCKAALQTLGCPPH